MKFTYLAILTLAFLLTNASAQTRPYSATDSQVQILLDRINNRTVAFQVEIDRTLDSSRIDGSQREDSINNMVADLVTSVNTLRNDFSLRRSRTSDVQNVLDRAALVNSFLSSNRVSTRAANQWSSIKSDFDTLARYYRLNSNWSVRTDYPNTQTGYTVGNLQMRNLLSRLRQHSTSFSQSFDRWSRYNRNQPTWSNENISQDVADFGRAVDELNRDYNGSDDAEAVLRPASTINRFILSNRVNSDVSSKWNLVRSDLTTLANYYRISWNWNDTTVPDSDNYGLDTRITGTYRLNTSRSDSVTNTVDQAIVNAGYNVNSRDRMRRNLERRLQSPEVLSIEKSGQQIILSSGNAAPVTLTADGVARTEISPNGRTVRTTVSTISDGVRINYEGDRMNDYFVTFQPIGSDQLRVTRRVYLENQNQTVTVNSIYDKTDRTPNWNTASYPTNTGGSGTFVIPNNTSLVATLDNSISTRNINEGDRFSMTVMSPSQYDGAVIEGNVFGERSGTVTGRANLSLSFDTIRLRDGRTYRFAGIVDEVRQPNGETISVTNEGTIRDGSQTKKTVTRAGIGALLGAVIGAIAGGGSGAAIGAGVGAGAGAGTVILQGRDNLELTNGSEFKITATAPANVAAR